MCELMALSFARPISADFSIREFALRSRENADGWGLAWYPDQSLALVKEPIEWRKSQYTNFLESYPDLQASIYLAHVRHKTRGDKPTHADTHPFAREWGGRDYGFAHNGTLEGPYWELPLGRYHPVGRTDSEHLFCHLLEAVAQRADQLASPESWRWLHGRLAALNAGSKINCLLSDGRRLLCYHDAAGYKGLTFRKVYIQSHETRRFEDPTLHVKLEGASFNHGFVVATCPLSSTGWQRFQPGELLVLEEGVVRFSSHRDSAAPVFAPVRPPS
jgi:glutamine amidotransferase